MNRASAARVGDQTDPEDRTEPTTTRMILPPAASRFLWSCHRRGLSPHTLRGYGQDLADFAQWFIQRNEEPADPQNITATDLREYREHLVRDRHCQPATVNRRTSAIRSYLRWALEEGTIERLPHFPPGMRRVVTAPRSLSRNEQNALLRAVERFGSARDVAIISLFLNTGLRLAELCSLSLGDVELGARKSTLTVRHGKGAKLRKIPLNRAAKAALRTYLSEPNERLGIPLPPLERLRPLFLGKSGRGLGPRGVEALVHKYAEAARLEHVGCHTLRHTFATNLLRAGVDLVKVAALLGHENVSTTAIYTRPSLGELFEAVERIAQ